MSDTSSNDPRSMEARVTQAGEAIGEHVKSATAATAAAAGEAQKIVEDAAAATVAAAGQAKKVLGDAGEAAQQAWSQAGEVAEDVVDTDRRATKSVSQQIKERPLVMALVGFALGYLASLWIHREGERPAIIVDEGANAKPLRDRR
jgi:cell division septum initiation protein DivIVA